MNKKLGFVVLVFVTGLVVWATALLAQAAGDRRWPQRTEAAPSPRVVELAGGFRAAILGSSLAVTDGRGRAIFQIEVEGDVEATGSLGQPDGIHLFVGSLGERGRVLTAVRVSSNGGRVVMRRRLGSGGWSLERRRVRLHRESGALVDVLGWDGRAYDSIRRNPAMWR